MYTNTHINRLRKWPTVSPLPIGWNSKPTTFYVACDWLAFPRIQALEQNSNIDPRELAGWLALVLALAKKNF